MKKSFNPFCQAFASILKNDPNHPNHAVSPPLVSAHKVRSPKKRSSAKKGHHRICCHGKQKHICKDCGGSSICVHGVQRNQCIPCKGAGVCVHESIRSQCVKCGGASICQHGKRKTRCIDCGGSAICVHRKVKYRCKECGGSAICIHSLVKYNCKICKSLFAKEKQAAANLANLAEVGKMPSFIDLMEAATD